MIRIYLRIVYGYVRNKLLDIKDLYNKVVARLQGRKILYSLYARVNNFGDQFNKDLLRYFNREMIYVKDYKKSQAVFTGSILGNFPVDYQGYILGAGFLLERYRRLDNAWKVRMLRGPLSGKQCGHTDVPFADPGILASLIYTEKVAPKFDLGIVPNGREKSTVFSMDFGDNVLVIDPHRDAKKVIKDIKSCRNIASSSLHGLIFADAFRIPNSHLFVTDKVLGGYHKFIDYYHGMETRHEVIQYEASISKDDIIEHCKLRFTDDYLRKKQEMVIATYKEVFNEMQAVNG